MKEENRQEKGTLKESEEKEATRRKEGMKEERR